MPTTWALVTTMFCSTVRNPDPSPETPSPSTTFRKAVARFTLFGVLRVDERRQHRRHLRVRRFLQGRIVDNFLLGSCGRQFVFRRLLFVRFLWLVRNFANVCRSVVLPFRDDSRNVLIRPLYSRRSERACVTQ